MVYPSTSQNQSFLGASQNQSFLGAVGPQPLKMDGWIFLGWLKKEPSISFSEIMNLNLQNSKTINFLILGDHTCQKIAVKELWNHLWWFFTTCKVIVYSSRFNLQIVGCQG